MTKIQKESITPDFQDLASATTLTDKQIGYMVEEIHALNTQCHEYLRVTTQSMTIIVAAVAAVIAFWDHSSGYTMGLLQNVVLLVFPILMGIILVYHFNVSTEISALAELRDRLSNRVNRKLGRQIFVFRVASDSLRGSLGTWLLLSLIGSILFTVLIVGLVNALYAGSGWLLGQVAVSILTVVSIVFAFFQNARVRIKVNTDLDTMFGTTDRPPTTPYTVWESLTSCSRPKG